MKEIINYYYYYLIIPLIGTQYVLMMKIECFQLIGCLEQIQLEIKAILYRKKERNN